MFFRELQQSVYIVESRLLREQDPETRQVDKLRMEALGQVRDYVLQLEWITHKKTKEKLLYFLRHNFDYVATAKRYNQTREALEVTVSRFSTALYKTIGKDTLKTLVDGSPDEIQTVLANLRGVFRSGIKDYFDPSILKALPPAEKSLYFSIAEAEKELKTLAILSKAGISRRISSLSKENLAHLRFLLESQDAKHGLERELLYSYLEGNIDTATLINTLTPKCIYS